MRTTRDFLAGVKRAYRLTSDYQLAKKLGVSRQAVSDYQAGKATLGDDAAIKVAALLELAPAYVLASMAAERAVKAEVRKAWERAAKVLAGGALAILAGCAVHAGLIDMDGAAGFLALTEGSARALYIMSTVAALILGTHLAHIARRR